MRLAAPSAPRLAIAVVAALAAFGIAFAVANAGSDDGGDSGSSGGASKIKLPTGSPSLPGVAVPATLPGLDAGRTAPRPA